MCDEQKEKVFLKISIIKSVRLIHKAFTCREDVALHVLARYRAKNKARQEEGYGIMRNLT
jgi:hypothetical protein